MSKRRDHMALDEHGAAAAEFALILPLLTLILFGFYEAGRMYWNYNTIQAAARDAARYAARMPMSCDDEGNGALTDGADEAQIQNLTRTGTLDGTGTPLVAGWTNNDDVSVDVACVSNTDDALGGVYTGTAQIPTVRVSARAPYRTLFGGLVGFALDSITVSNSQTAIE